MVIYPDGTFKKLVNTLAYVSRACSGWYNPYIKRIYYHITADYAVDVIYVLSDHRTVIGHWASHGVFIDYYTKRTRAHRGVQLIEY